MELIGTGLLLGRSDNLLEIQLLICDSIVPSNSKDITYWLPSKSKRFNVSATWNCIKVYHPKVAWSKLVWYKRALPKHSFFCWLVLLDRLSIRSRLHRQTQTIPSDCLFCGAGESKYHLFFERQFSSQLWNSTFLKIGKAGAIRYSWNQIVHRGVMY